MLGAYGNPDKTTLKLDQLAAEGMRFDRAYGSPVCTPTRLSLYAGLYPTRHGYTGVIPVPGGTQRFVDFKSQFPTYAQQLRQTGYLTPVTVLPEEKPPSTTAERTSLYLCAGQAQLNRGPSPKISSPSPIFPHLLRTRRSGNSGRDPHRRHFFRWSVSMRRTVHEKIHRRRLRERSLDF